MTFLNAVKQGIGKTGYHPRARFQLRLLSTLLAIGAVCCLAVAAREYSNINVDMPNHARPGFVAELDIFAVIVVSDCTLRLAAILKVLC